MDARKVPTKSEVESYLRDRRNWGRWRNNGSAGAINLITDLKRQKATDLVKSGRTISLSRPIPVTPTKENPLPALHYMSTITREPKGGGAVDFIGIHYHGQATTHIDALCHTWNDEGMWDGRDPSEEITFDGAKYGSVDAWSDGILTRGILLDVPKYRGQPYVTVGSPVHGWELEDIVVSQGLTLEPGDAVLVYSGREAYAVDHGGTWGDRSVRPGLHASCLPFIRDNDVSVLGWDMMDQRPNEYDVPWTVHGAIFAYGVALLDNSLLEPLARMCSEEGRYEFMLTINPLKLIGGTGSPVNPVAVF